MSSSDRGTWNNGCKQVCNQDSLLRGKDSKYTACYEDVNAKTKGVMRNDLYRNTRRDEYDSRSTSDNLRFNNDYVTTKHVAPHHDPQSATSEEQLIYLEDENECNIATVYKADGEFSR